MAASHSMVEFREVKLGIQSRVRFGAVVFVLLALVVSITSSCSTAISDLEPPAIVVTANSDFCSTTYAIDGSGEGYFEHGCEDGGGGSVSATHEVDELTVATLRSAFASIALAGPQMCAELGGANVTYRFLSPGNDTSVCVNDATPRPSAAYDLYMTMRNAVGE